MQYWSYWSVPQKKEFWAVSHRDVAKVVTKQWITNWGQIIGNLVESHFAYKQCWDKKKTDTGIWQIDGSESLYVSR